MTSHTMKTTLDLPDELLIEAKATAARRRTTPRSIVEHALRREIGAGLNDSEKELDAFIETSSNGLPCFKRTESGKVRSEVVYKLMEEEGI